MSFYQKLTKVGKKFVGYPTLFKYGFNLSPMYRRSTARIQSVSEDLSKITIRLPLNWKNKNYMGTIFGGSMFAAVDPIPMVQLVNIIGDDYIVWDKAAKIQFKRPANQTLTATFTFTTAEIEQIKADVMENNEIEIVKTTALTSLDEKTTFCLVDKTIYVADKKFYKQKRKKKLQAKQNSATFKE